MAWFVSRGDALAYGDAEAHLNIARRIWDNRLPEYREIGTVWLPLPHVLMLPFTWVNGWYRSGLAGALPAAMAWIVAGLCLFSGLRRITGSAAPALCALAVFAGNPNLLYLAASPMTEAFFFAAVFGLFRALIAFCERRSWWTLALSVLCVWCAVLTRYEGWILIPIAAVVIAWRDVRYGAAFLILASMAPGYWLIHNWWFYGDALEFYRGEWSARAIYGRTHGAGFARFPGDGNFAMAWVYFRTAVELVCGSFVYWIAICGFFAALWKRWFGWLALFGALPVFLLWSMYSGGGVELFVPSLWPYSYYNSRYALNALPLLALSAAALPAVVTWPRMRAAIAILVVLMAVVPWVLYPNANNWIVWKEAQVNSLGRLEWTRKMSSVFGSAYQPGDRIFYAFGDLTGVLRDAGIPLRVTTFDGNELEWLRTLARPDLFLKDDLVLDFADGKAAKAANRSNRYEVFARVPRKGASAVVLFRRRTGPSIL